MATSLQDRLRNAARARDRILKFYSIAEELEASGAGFATVRGILEFIEAHPRLDIGAPGPLVHYVESFAVKRSYRKRYERELLASLSRRPTASTVWMLNRMINVAKTKKSRELLLDAMRAAGKHPAAGSGARDRAAGFLEFQKSVRPSAPPTRDRQSWLRRRSSSAPRMRRRSP